MATVALMACAGQTDQVPIGEVAPEGNRVYTCPGDVRVAARIIGDSLRLTLPARNLTLPQVLSASGVKYEDGDVVFWTKGSAARLEVGGRVYEECTSVPVDSPWEEARLLGSTFRAVGQEPGWILDVYRDRLRYLGDYGETLLVFTVREPARPDAATVVYDAISDEHTLRVSIRETPCMDTMSGERFPYDVTLSLDGRELRGCGRPLNR